MFPLNDIVSFNGDNKANNLDKFDPSQQNKPLPYDSEVYNLDEFDPLQQDKPITLRFGSSVRRDLARPKS